MLLQETEKQPADSRGTRVALIYALVAEALSLHYQHGLWPTLAQSAHLCAEWLARSRRNLSLAERQNLARLADELARGMAETLSREAGLFAAHELMESLDPRYHSPFGESVMDACAACLEAADQA